MIEYSKYTWEDGDTEETWREIPTSCTICGKLSAYTTVQSSFMPGAQFLVVGLQLCSACQEELWRVVDKWEETDTYAEACLNWIANGYTDPIPSPEPTCYSVLKMQTGRQVHESIKAFRKRILDWVMEQRVEIE